MTDQTVRLTAEGKARLEAELHQILNERLPELSTRLKDANEHGDISDNAEYEDMKEERVRIDDRVRELEHILAHAQVIASTGYRADGRIDLGARVTLRTADGDEETWQLVSPAEAHAPDGSISTESPVGRALLGCRKGDSASATTPAGELRFTIINVA